MRVVRVGLVFAAVLGMGGAVAAQSTTGTISGRVIDAQALAVPA
jgi:hypothetical protein